MLPQPELSKAHHGSRLHLKVHSTTTHPQHTTTFAVVFSQSSHLLFLLKHLGPAVRWNTEIQAFLAAYTDMQKSPRQSEISRRKQIKKMGFFLKKHLFMSFHGLFFFLVWLMVFKSLGLANLSNMWPEESTWCSLPQQKHMGTLCRSTPVLLAQAAEVRFA